MEFDIYKALHERIFLENGLGCFLDNDVSRETKTVDTGSLLDATPNVSCETKGGDTSEDSEKMVGSVSHETTALFWKLTEHMLAVNEQMNLTAVRDAESVIYLHYADSLMISEEIPRGVTLCDVGCGAGFPTLPLAIARLDLHFTAIDSTEKKVRYVVETAKLLGIGDRLNAISARAETLGQGEMREVFACVTARAVSNLRMLSELCLPLVAVGGAFLSMKGANWEVEYREAENAISLLGGRLEKTEEFEIRNGDESEKRCLLVIRKVAPCPPKYPRAWGKIKNKPL